MNQGPQVYDWLTLAAIVLGPLIGIWVTRAIDKRNEQSKRREAVFEALIKTRGLELSFEHTGALNMVPFLFPEAAVRDAYSRTMVALNDTALGSTDQTVLQGAIHRVSSARNDLIREVGTAVGLPLPQNEMERLGYAPSAWTRQYTEQETLRSHLIEAFEGRRALHTVATMLLPPSPPGVSQDPLLEEPDQLSKARKRKRWWSKGSGGSGA